MREREREREGERERERAKIYATKNLLIMNKVHINTNICI